MDIYFKTVNEYEIDEGQRHQILALLKECFPGYFDCNIFFKQISKERILAYHKNRLIGQLGLENRVIRIGNELVSIFGVVDLCVYEKYRLQGVATELLKIIEEKAKRNKVNFCLLFADEHNLYLKNGYSLVNNECVWLGIEDNYSIGIIKRKLNNCMLVKKITGNTPWDNSASIDLLGHIF